MPTDPPFPTRPRRSAIRLVEVLQREPVAEGFSSTDSFFPEPCEVDANPALLDQAKGALMLHFGVDSHQAFAVLLSWAQISGAPVPTVAHTLMHGICEGNPQTEVRHGPLMRWLEAQLRNGHADHAPHRTTAQRCEPTHRTPRPE